MKTGPPCILLIDDEPQVLDLLQWYLSHDHRCDVQASTSLSQAIPLLHDRRPDLIFCDVMLPRRIDHPFWATLGAIIRPPPIPLIFMSVLPPEQCVDLAPHVDFLQKPFALPTVGALVTAWLS